MSTAFPLTRTVALQGWCQVGLTTLQSNEGRRRACLAGFELL
jgi:hypothetical protein